MEITFLRKSVQHDQNFRFYIENSIISVIHYTDFKWRWLFLFNKTIQKSVLYLPVLLVRHFGVSTQTAACTFEQCWAVFLIRMTLICYVKLTKSWYTSVLVAGSGVAWRVEPFSPLSDRYHRSFCFVVWLCCALCTLFFSENSIL
jgi:hypothetical protein